MNFFSTRVFTLYLTVLLAWPALAQQTVVTAHSSQPHVEVSLISESASVVAGQVLNLAVRLQSDDGWHTYWRNPGDTGLPTRIKWTLPKGFYAGGIEWPMPERINYGELVNFGYHGDTWLLVPIAVPHDLPVASGEVLSFSATVKWLVCEAVCIPGEATLAIDLPVAAADKNRATVANKQWASYFAQARSNTPQLLNNVMAEYKLAGKNAEQVVVKVALKNLPAFNQKPKVFFANSEIVSNVAEPTVTLDDKFLLVYADKDQYLETPAEFLSLIISSSNGATEMVNGYELVVQYNPDLQLAAVANAAVISSNSTGDTNLLMVLLFALLGGLILNAMPCVFPVLSLKVISLVESGSQSPRIRQMQGIAYTSGVISSFLLVAATLIALRGLGEQIGWGFQLQSPLFVGFLVYILFLLGLSMSGVIEIGSSLQNVGAGLTGEHLPSEGWKKSFFTGVLATIVATPCTAPFMGSAMGFALGQPLFVSLSVFAVMGLGLALPFLLIAFVPALASALPRPGAWMVKLKEVLAFPLYLTAVWLLWVFAHQAGYNAATLLLIGLVLLAFAAWLWRTTLLSERAVFSKSMVLLAGVLAIILLFSAIDIDENVHDLANAEQTTNQNTYTPQRLSDALANGDTVFVNMTADWCITCKVNERVALKTDAVQQAFAEQSVVYLKGDWTNSNAEITHYLEQFNRNGVPLYVVYKKGEAARVLPQLLTAGMLVEAVK